MKIKVKKLTHNAYLPYKATKGSLGFDIYTLNNVELEPFKPVAISTGIAIELPEGFGIEIRDRSSLGLKGIKYLGGEIDNDYRGEVKVVLINLTKEKIILNEGERVAQMIPRKIYEIEIEEANCLTATARGSGGFGSTNNVPKILKNRKYKK